MCLQRQWRRSALIASILVAMSVMCGCGARTEMAKAVAMERQAVEASARLNALEDVTAEDRERINALLHSALQLTEPVMLDLAAGEEIQVPTTVEMAIADTDGFRTQASMQAAAAMKEAEERAWWRDLGRQALRWLDVAAQSTLGISLGALGIGSGIAGVAAGVMRWRRRIKDMLGAALQFGESADDIVKMAPEDVRDKWAQAKGAIARTQTALGVRGAIDRERARVKSGGAAP